MNLVQKVIFSIKKMFSKQEETKELEMPKEPIQYVKKNNFSNKLAVNTNKKQVETLICDGDGLGIKKKMNC